MQRFSQGLSSAVFRWLLHSDLLRECRWHLCGRRQKSYGTCKLAEGAPIEGRRVVVIEDVVTSGGQVAESIAALIERGARVDTALCVIDREQGGRELLASNGVELRSLFTMRQLEEAAR